MLTILSEKKKRAFHQQFLGRHREVLFEKHKDKDLMTGFTDNYIKVELPYDEKLINTLMGVQLMGITESGNVSVVAQDIPEGIFDYV